MQPKYEPNPLIKKYGHHTHQGTKKTSASALKKQIRSTKRSLQKIQNETKKLDLNKRTKMMEEELLELKHKDSEDVLAKKYQYIKFVELKKVNRKLKQFGADDQERAKYDRFSKYINYFPIDCKYISLFPKEESSSQLKDDIMARIGELDEQKLLHSGYSWRFRIEKHTGDQPTEEPDEFFI